MRRKTILSACTALRQALTESGLTAFYRQMRDAGGAPARARNDQLLGAVLKFTPLAGRFDDATREVMRILELDFIQDPQWLIATVSGDEATAGRNLADFAFSMSLMETYLPRFTGLVRADPVERFIAQVRENPELAERFQTLQVQVIDDAEERTPVERLIGVLESVRELHAVSCRIAGIDDRLCVLALDSGGDKTVDFFGAAAAMAGLREILLSMWDKVVFYRSARSGDRNRLVAENLSVLWELQALQETGKLSAQDAAELRRRTIDAALRFLEAGATIPEIENRATFEPRELMAPAGLASAPARVEPARPTPQPEPDSEAEATDDFDDSGLFAPAAPAPATAKTDEATRSELTQTEMQDLQRFLNRQIKID